jgi:hypothetical protein
VPGPERLNKSGSNQGVRSCPDTIVYIGDSDTFPLDTDPYGAKLSKRDSAVSRALSRTWSGKGTCCSSLRTAFLVKIPRCSFVMLLARRFFPGLLGTSLSNPYPVFRGRSRFIPDLTPYVPFRCRPRILFLLARFLEFFSARSGRKSLGVYRVLSVVDDGIFPFFEYFFELGIVLFGTRNMASSSLHEKNNEHILRLRNSIRKCLAAC